MLGTSCAVMEVTVNLVPFKTAPWSFKWTKSLRDPEGTGIANALIIKRTDFCKKSSGIEISKENAIAFKFLENGSPPTIELQVFMSYSQCVGL